MSRKLRIEYPGAMYHVMNRGDQREDIFRDDQDKTARSSYPRWARLSPKPCGKWEKTLSGSAGMRTNCGRAAFARKRP
jgi:hypothetical protein